MARRKLKVGKVPSYKLIGRESDADKALYAMLSDLIEKHHEHLTNARVVLAWNLAWKPDVDGRVTLGKCRRASDLDRELAPYDFVILLRRSFFEDPDVSEAQRRALLDHELCHAEVKLDQDGEPERDSRGRTIYRMRKHDIEEFSAIIRRHGCYKRDLEDFAAAIERAKQAKLPGFESPADKAAKDPAAKAAMNALRPRKGSSIESVTFGMPGKEPVTFTQDDAKALSRGAKQLRGRA
jgi:hypothetical protein